MAKSLDLIMAIFHVSKLENARIEEKQQAKAQRTAAPLHWPANNVSFRVRGNSLSRQCGTQTHFLRNKCNAKRISFSHIIKLQRTPLPQHSGWALTSLCLSPLPWVSLCCKSVKACVVSHWPELKVHLTEICCTNKEHGFTDPSDLMFLFFFPTSKCHYIQQPTCRSLNIFMPTEKGRKWSQHASLLLLQ